MATQCTHNDSTGVEWSRETSQYIAWDDGHTPESFPASETGGLRVYPEFHESSSSFISAIPDAGPPELADAIYNFTIQQAQPTWGAYVLWEDAKHAMEHPSTYGADTPWFVSKTNQTTLDQLALNAAAVFVQQQNSSLRAHGVAVWALAANDGSNVPYHIDYAEWIRYRYNITVLPILAGTWQCTRGEANIDGGEFWAHKKGLEHYKRHGYKAALSPIDETDKDWVQIPYRFNQLIVQSGQLPHLSTAVNSIADNWKRVIVGFNVFLSDVGPLVQESPEHSETFRSRVRTMRLHQQRMRSIGRMSDKMKRLLVTAKRQKVKEDFQKAQDRLDVIIQNHIKCQMDNGSTASELASCAKTLISEDCWPCNEDDITAYLHRRCKDGFLLQRNNGSFILGNGNDSWHTT